MITLLSPGDPAQRTGGYLYNAAMVDALSSAGVAVNVIALPGDWPEPSAADEQRCVALIDGIAGGIVILDGLALVAVLPVLDALRTRARVVLLLHLPLSAERGLTEADAARLNALEARAVVGAHTLVATSPHAARRFEDLHGRPIHSIAPGCAQMPQAQGTGGGRLLCAGSLTPRKGHLTLLRALARLKHLPWSLVCAGGPGPESHVARLRQCIADEKLTSRVTLTGSLGAEQMRREYALADAFVLATWDETYGMALAEAAASGLPIISTTAGAVPQTVPSGAGLLVKPGDVTALAQALSVVLTNDRAATLMAHAARAAPVRTWDMVGEEWEQLMRSLSDG